MCLRHSTGESVHMFIVQSICIFIKEWHIGYYRLIFTSSFYTFLFLLRLHFKPFQSFYVFLLRLSTPLRFRLTSVPFRRVFYTFSVLLRLLVTPLCYFYAFFFFLLLRKRDICQPFRFSCKRDICRPFSLSCKRDIYRPFSRSCKRDVYRPF